MAQIEPTAQTVIVHINGADRLWALTSHLETHLAHVTSAQPATEEAQAWLHGIRLGGTHVPGGLSASRFYQHGDLVFWDVHHPDKAIAIGPADERYARLVIEVENPAATLAALAQAIRAPAVTRVARF